MRRHDNIIKLGIDLEYFKDESGVCNGVSYAWIEACFCNEEAAFNKRMDKISSLIDVGSFIEELSAIKEKVKHGALLSDEERELLDVLAFFEKISLYQKPDKNKVVFDERLGQHDCEKISRIISSDKIQERGGLTSLSVNNGIYTVEEISEYLSGIASAIDKSSPTSDKEVAVIICSPDHCMALVYEKYELHGAIIPVWNFFDINLQEPALFRLEQIESVVKLIRDNYFDEKYKYILLSTSIITTEMNPNRDRLVSDINSIELASSLMSEKLESKSIGSSSNDIFQLAQQILIFGNLDMLYKLNPQIVDEVLTQMTFIHPRALIYLMEQGYNSNSILLKAAELDLPDVIDACAAKSIDLDIPFKPFQPPPLFIAARNGNLKAIRAFQNHGVKLDTRSPDGTNLMHVAAKMGHDNVIAWLAMQQPGLLKQTDSEGETPAEFAAKEGFEAALREIIKSSPMSEDDWNKLLMIAADNGHTHLIALFVSQGVNLSQLSPNGYGAAHVAAQAGNVTFLSELGIYGVDLSAESKNGESPLMLALVMGYFQKTKHTETINAIRTIIEDQLKQRSKTAVSSSKQYMRSLQPENEEITLVKIEPKV